MLYLADCDSPTYSLLTPTCRKPAKPLSVSVDPLNPAGVQVSWNVSQASTTYIVDCLSTDGGTERQRTVKKKTSYTFAPPYELSPSHKYVCKVAGSNGTEVGAYKSSSAFMVATAPQAPSNVYITDQAVSFDAPGDNGGSPIIEYIISCQAERGEIITRSFADCGEMSCSYMMPLKFGDRYLGAYIYYFLLLSIYNIAL